MLGRAVRRSGKQSLFFLGNYLGALSALGACRSTDNELRIGRQGKHVKMA